MVNKKIEATRKGVVPKILAICDHNESAAFWLSNPLRDNFDIIHRYGFDKAIDIWEHEIPDLVVIDVENYGPSTLELIGKLREITISPILLLVFALSEEQIVEAYWRGLDDCIIRPVGPTLIAAKVRAWLRRAWTLTDDALEEIRVGDFILNLSERTLTLGSQPPVKLTNLELRLLHLLMSHSPRTVSYDEIIHRVWGNLSEADYAALKNVVYRLRLKIESNPNEPRYLVTLLGIGYKFDPKQE